MTYQCIPLSDKDYKATLKRVLAHPTKSKKYARFKENDTLITKIIKKVKTLDLNDELLALLEGLKKDQKICQEGMAKLLDSEYRAMLKEAKNEVIKKDRKKCPM